MANKDYPHGFNPWNEVLRARVYPVQTAPAIAFYHGDLVQADITGFASAKLGVTLLIYDTAVILDTSGATLKLLGSVLAVYDENMDPIKYMDVGRVGDGTTAGYLLITDHPYQQYEAQSDSAFTVANLDLNHEITVAALNAGDNDTGISVMEIDATTGAAVTVTIPIRLYGQAYPGEDVYSAAGCRMICQINPLCHYYGSGLAV